MQVEKGGVCTPESKMRCRNLHGGLVHDWGESGAGDWQTDLCRISSDVGVVPICSRNKRSKHESESVAFLFCGNELGVALKEWGERLRVEPLLLHIKKSTVRWFGHLLNDGVWACPTGKKPRAHPEHTWDYISWLAWISFSVPALEELEEVPRAREIWVSLLRLLPPEIQPKERSRKWIDRLVIPENDS